MFCFFDFFYILKISQLNKYYIEIKINKRQINFEKKTIVFKEKMCFFFLVLLKANYLATILKQYVVTDCVASLVQY